MGVGPGGRGGKRGALRKRFSNAEERWSGVGSPLGRGRSASQAWPTCSAACQGVAVPPQMEGPPRTLNQAHLEQPSKAGRCLPHGSTLLSSVPGSGAAPCLPSLLRSLATCAGPGPRPPRGPPPSWAPLPQPVAELVSLPVSGPPPRLGMAGCLRPPRKPACPDRRIMHSACARWCSRNSYCHSWVLLQSTNTVQQQVSELWHTSLTQTQS